MIFFKHFLSFFMFWKYFLSQQPIGINRITVIFQGTKKLGSWISPLQKCPQTVWKKCIIFKYSWNLLNPYFSFLRISRITFSRAIISRSLCALMARLWWSRKDAMSSSELSESWKEWKKCKCWCFLPTLSKHSIWVFSSVAWMSDKSLLGINSVIWFGRYA